MLSATNPSAQSNNPNPVTQATSKSSSPIFVASRPCLAIKSKSSEAIESDSDEERTHYSVLSRRMHKRRKTNRALVSNPFREVPQTKFDLSSTPPSFGLDGVFIGDFDDLACDIANSSTSTQQRYPNRRNSIVPESDLYARQRCYEYLHTAIDAVWAEYCDSTSFAESQKYMPHSPVSDGEFFVSSGDENAKAVYTKKRHARSDSISMQPLNQSLMKQKKKLVDAKYLLSHFVSGTDFSSSTSFWQVWDNLKYNAIEIVEGDEDEIEEVIDDLEEGRC